MTINLETADAQSLFDINVKEMVNNCLLMMLTLHFHQCLRSIRTIKLSKIWLTCKYSGVYRLLRNLVYSLLKMIPYKLLYFIYYYMDPAGHVNAGHTGLSYTWSLSLLNKLLYIKVVLFSTHIHQLGNFNNLALLSMIQGRITGPSCNQFWWQYKGAVACLQIVFLTWYPTAILIS